MAWRYGFAWLDRISYVCYGTDRTWLYSSVDQPGLLKATMMFRLTALFESCTGQSSQMRILFSLGSYLSHKLAPRRPRLLWNTMQTSVRLLVWYRTWDAWSRTWISVQPQFWSCLASDRELCICCYANLWCVASFWILIKPDCVSLWCIKVCFKFLI